MSRNAPDDSSDFVAWAVHSAVDET